MKIRKSADRALQLLFAGEWIYATAITTTKFSILAMYRRIFPTRFMNLGFWILGGMTTAWWLAVILVATFQCDPVGKVFDPFMATGHCISIAQFFLGNSIPNIINDVMILCLPIYEISQLHLPRGQRIALAGVFLLGALVIVSSGIRLRYHLILADEGSDLDLTSKTLLCVLSLSLLREGHKR